MDSVKTWLLDHKDLLEAIAAVFAIIACVYSFFKAVIAWYKVITSHLERNNPVLIRYIRDAVLFTIVLAVGFVLAELAVEHEHQGKTDEQFIEYQDQKAWGQLLFYLGAGILALIYGAFVMLVHPERRAGRFWKWITPRNKKAD